MDELLRTPVGALPGAPTFLDRGGYVRNRISGLLKQYLREYPHEVQLYGEYCQKLRGSAEWTGKFSPVIYNSREKDYAWEMKVPQRLHDAMVLIFHKNWTFDKEIVEEFYKQAKIFVIKGTPRPDITAHLGK